MTEPIHSSAPVPVGDVVRGDPPVPITVWTVAGPVPGESMSNALGVRLVHNLTHPADLVIDATDGPQLARAIIAARRRSHPLSPRAAGGEAAGRSGPAALIVTGWPLARDATARDGAARDAAAEENGATEGTTAVEFFVRCRAGLRPGGCVAVLLPHGDPTLPADVVRAAKTAGLAYLQHVVAATGSTARDGNRRLDIHTDVLILIRSTRDADSTHDTASVHDTISAHGDALVYGVGTAHDAAAAGGDGDG